MRAQIERAVEILAFLGQPGVVGGVGAAVGQALHQRQVVMHLAPDHAALHQLAEALVEHLAAPVQAGFERLQPADLAHQWMLRQRRIERVQHP